MLVEDLLDVRHRSETHLMTPNKVQYMGVSPRQVVSVRVPDSVPGTRRC